MIALSTPELFLNFILPLEVAAVTWLTIEALPTKLVVVRIIPVTSRGTPGLVVPIPTLP